MNKDQLALKIKEIAWIQGHFTLRSGQVSSQYFDKYLFESQPAILKALTVYMTELIPKDTEVLAGLEMGGIPLVTALSLQTGLPCCFVRKEAKSYGTQKIAEGSSIENKKICIVEDVVTTGGQIIKSTRDLKNKKAKVEHVICVINRGGVLSIDKLKKEAELQLTSLFTLDNNSNLL